MKILVPLNNEEFLQDYIDSGADEFYLGFHDLEWNHKFGKYDNINRMSEFGVYANRYSFEEFVEIAKIIKKNKKSVFVTLNANSYSKEQIEFIIKKYVPGFLDASIDGAIVSDLFLGEELIKKGVIPIASTMCSIYNSDIGNYYVKHGVKRLILPRDISLDEISVMVNNISGAKIEVFFMRNGCIFSDGFCLGTHGSRCGSTCGLIRRANKSTIVSGGDFKLNHDVALNDYTYNKLFHNEACAMCALYRMMKMGIYSLKIVGRADEATAICRDIKITKENIIIAENCQSEEEYLSKMIMPFGSIEKCMMGMNCYYPEVRFV